jgi:hypothetical protein
MSTEVNGHRPISGAPLAPQGVTLVKVDDAGLIVLVSPGVDLPLVSVKVGEQEPLRLSVGEAYGLADALVLAASKAQ